MSITNETKPVFLKEEFSLTGQKEGHDYVDLGLPSGLKWATCNVGAVLPEESGNLFSWGETKPKKHYVLEDYSLYENNNEDWDDEDEDYEEDYSIWKYDDPNDEIDPEDDTASANWGESWRMPTIEEFTELKENCEIVFGEYNSATGFKVTGPNGNSIFLPAAGLHDEDGLEGVGKVGVYWSSSLYETYTWWDDFGCFCARTGIFSASETDEPEATDWRHYGLSVRPVLR